MSNRYEETVEKILREHPTWNRWQAELAADEMPYDGERPPMTVEERAWATVAQLANQFGVHHSHRSDLFILLAAILAYYKVRGTEPQDMLTDVLLRTIDNLIEEAKS